jgi:hypothetical protein
MGYRKIFVLKNASRDQFFHGRGNDVITHRIDLGIREHDMTANNRITVYALDSHSFAV